MIERNSFTASRSNEPRPSLLEKTLKSVEINDHLLNITWHPSSIWIIVVVIILIPCKYKNRYSMKNSLESSLLVSQLIIGWHYSKDCPINHLIPYYLIVSGLVGLVLIALTILAQLMAQRCPVTVPDDMIDISYPFRTTKIVSCGICSIMCVNLSLIVFLIGWFIAGWIWVLQVWYRVQYSNSKRNDYCHPVLYHTACWFLVVLTILQFSCCYSIARKTGVHVQQLRGKQSVTNEDS